MFDFLGQLADRGIEVKPNTQSPDEYKICCPFCESMGTSPDYRFRLGFNIQSGLASCFNCGYRSRKAILDLVRVFGLSSDGVGEFIPTRKTRERAVDLELPEGFQLLHEIEADDDLFGAARRYVDKRGITQEQLKRHRIGATVSDWKFRYRVIFPIWDKDKKLLGYTGRDWTGKQQIRYLLSEGCKSVYNGRLDLYPDRIIVLAEGVTKSLAIERALRNKVCSAAVFGKTVTDVQLEQIKGFREICLFEDPDNDGASSFLRVAQNLVTQFERVSLVWPWPRKQADEMTEQEIRGYIKGRRPFSDLLAMQFRKEMMSR